ncbi:hypothetical protein O3M35_005406 [Rhynocoris fuscipes]|uniref:DNA-3-methyladenine glycosylase n=1 Tax=Rhynocoris fuscipes TaxID=488301 RepID=A0AAW1DQ98_9HEMI
MNMQITEEKDSMNSQKNFQRLLYSDYDVPCFTFAKNLLGILLCRRLETGEVVKGIIIETECYPGGIDKASLSFEGKKTERNTPMFMSPGTAFVYLTYGMYHCFNISSQGDGAAVLLRAIEPKYGIEAMRKNRINSYKGKTSARKKPFTNLDLCSGPSKLCMSFAIDRSLNKEDMVESDKLWLEWPSDKSQSLNEDKQIVACARIGIDSVGKEWASKPYRFYLYGNPYVSKRDKKAEQSFAINVNS